MDSDLIGEKSIGIKIQQLIKNFAQGAPIHSAIVKAIQEGNMRTIKRLTANGLDWGSTENGIVRREFFNKRNPGPYVFPEKYTLKRLTAKDGIFYKNYINPPVGETGKERDMALSTLQRASRSQPYEPIPVPEPKLGREVIIKQTENGFIVQVGCATFVETSRKRMFAALCEYWSDPDKAAKKYYHNKQK